MKPWLAWLVFLPTIAFAQFDESQLSRHSDADILLKEKAAANFRSKVKNSQSIELIVSYHSEGRSYKSVKRDVLNKIATADVEEFRNYSHLPMNAVRIRSTDKFLELLRDPNVKAVYTNDRLEYFLNQTLPYIEAPSAYDLGVSGDGASVVVVDSGINYTHADFGNCTAPGVPASCRVVASLDIAPDDGQLDDNGHGTNVAGIVAGTAPQANIIGLDVDNASSISSADILAAIDWSIDNQATYNIKAINLSIGSTETFSSCLFNPYNTPVAQARSAGIVVVAANGNGAVSDGISLPACVPDIVAVGAVYDANIGSPSFGVCSDSSSAADQVACFSNSANIMSLWAPGVSVIAGGFSASGTSQAAPHVSGAVALLYSAFPQATAEQLEQKLLQSDVLVTDDRNPANVAKPRLNLLTVIGAVNDSFANAASIGSVPASSLISNIDATSEANEPVHGGQTNQSSLWWQVNLAETAYVCLSSSNSQVPTFLSVYSGSEIENLVELAASDGAEVCLWLQAGQQYSIAVASTETGNINLQLTESDPPIVAAQQIPMLPFGGLLLLVIGLFIVSFRARKTY